MPSLCNFDAGVYRTSLVLGAKRLTEYDVVTSDQPPPFSPTAPADRPIMDKVVGNKATDPSSVTNTAQCYIPSTPNEYFRVTVHNHYSTDACVAVYVDGEWVYSGLSYAGQRTVNITGRLINEKKIEQMRFVDLKTTCTPPPLPRTGR